MFFFFCLLPTITQLNQTAFNKTSGAPRVVRPQVVLIFIGKIQKYLLFPDQITYIVSIRPFQLNMVFFHIFQEF